MFNVFAAIEMQVVGFSPYDQVFIRSGQEEKHQILITVHIHMILVLSMTICTREKS